MRQVECDESHLLDREGGVAALLAIGVRGDEGLQAAHLDLTSCGPTVKVLLPPLKAMAGYQSRGGHPCKALVIQQECSHLCPTCHMLCMSATV